MSSANNSIPTVHRTIVYIDGRIVIGFSPDRDTNDMKDAAGGAAFKIIEGQLKRSQFPRRVEITPGIWVERPAKWR